VTPAAHAATTGRVVWITGLPCSGKSTVARRLHDLVRADVPASVVLDGDALRPILAEELGYGLDDRRRCAWRYARLAAHLAGQGVLVLVATVSLFDEVRSWSRMHAPRYFEVYLRVPEAVRRSRDGDGLYARTSVVGVDLPFDEPTRSELAIDDDGTLDAGAIAARIRRALSIGTAGARAERA